MSRYKYRLEKSGYEGGVLPAVDCWLVRATLATRAAEYYLSDRQGSTLGLIGASGSLDASFAYDAYGNLSSATGTASTPLLYGGQYLDQATGFYYLRARWYDPGSDEFLGVDPDVAETGEPFSYAGDNPVNAADPSGLMNCGPSLGCWPGDGEGGSLPPCTTTSTPAPPANPVLVAMRFFVGKDLRPLQAAAGLVGNFLVESGLDPGCVQSTTGVCTYAGSSIAVKPVLPSWPQEGASLSGVGMA